MGDGFFLRRLREVGMLKVNEIFYSIQGESTYAGLACVFVRLTGCNLRCSYCDTQYAYSEGVEISVAEVIEKVRGYGCRLVELTGGEPLLSPEVYDLMDGLLSLGYQVLLETNGSLDLSRVDGRVIKIMDIKCPDSGESDKNLLSNLEHLTERDQIKFVIGSYEDYLWARGVMAEQGLSGRRHLLMGAVFGRVPPKLLAEWILRDGLPVRLQLQLHKYIWAPDARGV